MERAKTKATIWVVEQGQRRSRLDQLATEEPLEIRLTAPPQTIAITMRTPGADFELAAGFLLTEGVIRQREDVCSIRYCLDPEVDGEQRHNIVTVALRDTIIANVQSLERHFYINSACGVCGKTSLEALKLKGYPPISDQITVTSEVICGLPDTLRTHQGIFTATGGLHAAAVFDRQGTLLAVKEDVGRHNALDKLIGSAFLAGTLPWSDRIVLVSGRSSFEILQKCLVARVPIVCAVSAPSSLAVALAKEFGITLIGFVRGDRFNIYTEAQRILLGSRSNLD
jgi:FdhD protein